MIGKDGKKAYLEIQEALEDFEDLKELRKEKEEAIDEPTIPLKDVVNKPDL